MTNQTVISCGYCNQSLPQFAQRCPRCEHDVGATSIDEPNKSTILEPIEDMTGSPITAGEAIPLGNVVPYRPVSRPRRAMLCILDDGKNDGEWVRIRSDSVVIGRADGEIVVNDDHKISTRHAEIIRKSIGGYSRWFLRDLESTNGTFVKVGTAKLVAGSEIMIGLRRFNFRLPELETTSEVPAQRNMTQGWAVGASPKTELPKLVELESDDPITFEFEKGSTFTIGASAGECHLVIPNDPTVEPRHAEIAMDRSGHWKINALPSMNGTWFRINEVQVDKTCLFQAGEQRFKLEVQ